MSRKHKHIIEPRISLELNWMTSHIEIGVCWILLNKLKKAFKEKGIAMSPGHGHLTDSLLMYGNSITRVHPYEWHLPLECFTDYYETENDIVLETGSGGIAEAEKVLLSLKATNIKIEEIEKGSFRLEFLKGNSNISRIIIIHILEYPELDKFQHTIVRGWREIDDEILRKFKKGETENTIWFETDLMREWLVEFAPESMSDLVLLRALLHPDGMKLFPSILHRRQNPDCFPSSNRVDDMILKESYGFLVYEEQAVLLKQTGFSAESPLKRLAHKGHNIARTMFAVEAVAMTRQ
ncbi:MAG: hypothetical protein J6T04_01520 [Bacteroidales bacterium]|nr:hypothetical protein [Bacteroidales bacterium]